MYQEPRAERPPRSERFVVAERARDNAGRLPHGGGRRRGFIRPRIGRVGLTDASETKTRKRSAARPALTTPFLCYFSSRTLNRLELL